MKSVLGPDKRTWKVGRRWLPKRLRLPRRSDFDASDGLLGLDIADSVSGLVLGLVVALTLALALIFVWPLLALAIELIAIVFVALGALIGRVVFRRPWLIVATTHDAPAEQLGWRVSGWRASGDAIETVATALRAGREPSLPGIAPLREAPRTRPLEGAE